MSPSRMAASAEAEETPESPNKTDSSILSVLTNQFVSEASNIPKRLYCPFCLFDFGFDFLLKAHIRDLHVLEIRNFSETRLDTFTFDPCSFCHAKFYSRGVLPRHILRRHQESILPLISSVNAALVSCKFCSYKASLRQLKLLYIHVENKHLQEFVKVLNSYNLSLTAAAQEPDRSVEDGVLNEEIRKLSLGGAAETMETLKPILKRATTNDYESLQTADQSWAPRTRRKLRFDLPDLSSSMSSDKENASAEKPKRLFGLKVARPKPKTLITPNKVQPEPERNVLGDITASALESFLPSDDGVGCLDAMPFRCGICAQPFDCNLTLRMHVKRAHGRVTLQPRYRCGLCKAKFYRNSYLLKHHRAHTKPKCLGAYAYYKPV